MKVIKLEESQFKKLFETSPAVTGDFSDGVPKYTGNRETALSPLHITNSDGEDSSKDVKTNEIPKRFGKFQVPQQFGTLGGRHSSNTV